MSYLERYFSSCEPSKRKSSVIAYLAALDHLTEVSPQVAAAIVGELRDERSHVKLIASENFSSLAVQLAMGNLLTDKYAEGYPRHRFYAGCEHVDTVEELAQSTLKAIFNCDHAYVQPHSGADANLVAFWAILIQRVQNRALERLAVKSVDALTPADYEVIRRELMQQKLLAMSLNSGGHLTHGYRHNLSSKIMQASHYEVDPVTEQLDYGALHEQAQRERPLILLAGYSAYTRRLNFATLRTIADEVGAVLLVDMAHFSGLVAGRVFQGDENPIPYAHIVTSTTHKTFRGPRGGIILCCEEFREIVDKGCPLVLGGPLPHVIAAKAVAFQEANTTEFCSYAQKIVDNARQLAARLASHGLRLVSGGTDNHQVLVDVTNLGLTGRQAEQALRAAGMTVNRNAIPNDSNGPWYTSGIRLGTAATTTLGMDSSSMDEIGDCIYEILHQTTAAPSSRVHYTTDSTTLEAVRSRIAQLLEHYPLYPEILI